MMKALYPLKAGKKAFPRFRYDFILSPGESVGMCLMPRKNGKGMKRMLARYAEFSSRPYREVLDEVFVRNTAILIVDPIVYEGAAGTTSFWWPSTSTRTTSVGRSDHSTSGISG